MAKKHLDWQNAKLDNHSKQKHKILREYFFKYITIRCQLPQQEKFRLVVVDGFAGGGKYKCGSSGSPLIFIEELKKAINFINLDRANQSLKTIDIECLLILNDANLDTLHILKDNITSVHAEIKENDKKLHLNIEYLNTSFEKAYPQIKNLINNGRYGNILFNLDQYGHKSIEKTTLLDIMSGYRSPEIFYTFAIQSLIAYLPKNKKQELIHRLSHLGIHAVDLQNLEGLMNNQMWLGTVERLVFESFKNIASFHSPFSIHNPNGWRYWLIHFANSYRARQVYNEVLHDSSNTQAHFGRSGLKMLSYDPSHDDASVYLFDAVGRQTAREQLFGDIERYISESSDAMIVGEFFKSIYNETPAHTDDINSVIIENPDIKVITPAGGERRMPHTIETTDILKIDNQKSFFPMFKQK